MVLIVEDNAALRELFLETLFATGYSARGVSSAAEALALLDGDAAQPELALLDVGLRGMDGIELAARLWQRFPALPVILSSGQPLNEHRSLTHPECFRFLLKPFTVRTLRTAIEELLRCAASTPDRRAVGTHLAHGSAA